MVVVKTLTLAGFLVMAACLTAQAQGKFVFEDFVSPDLIATGENLGSDFKTAVWWGTTDDASTFTKLEESEVSYFGTTGGGPAIDGAGLFSAGVVTVPGQTGTIYVQQLVWDEQGWGIEQIGSIFEIQLSTVAPVTIPPQQLVLPIPAHPPILWVDPADQVVPLGGTARFIAILYNYWPETSYRWQKDGQDLVNGGNVAGAETIFLTLRNVSEEDVAQYRLKATYRDLVMDHSQPATLTLTPPILAIAGSEDLLTLSWPTAASAFRLQQNEQPVASDDEWLDVEAPTNIEGNTITLTLTNSGHQRFFRLMKP